MSMTSVKVDGYEKQLSAQIDEWRAEVEKLRAQANQKEGEVRVRYANQISHLEAHLDKLQDMKKKMKDATDQAWGNIKSSVDQTQKDLKMALDRVVSDLS